VLADRRPDSRVLPEYVDGLMYVEFSKTGRSRVVVWQIVQLNLVFVAESVVLLAELSVNRSL
jgi:hypothetical protein